MKKNLGSVGEKIDGKSLSDLSSVLLRIQDECAKPNSPSVSPLTRVYESKGEQIVKFLKELGSQCEYLTPQEKEKLYFSEIRRLTNEVHQKMTKSVIHERARTLKSGVD